MSSRTTTQNNPLKLQMIVARDSPMEIILNFHSSKSSVLRMKLVLRSIIPLAVVMNFITHKAAYSLFPRATFEERKTVACRNGWDQRDQVAYRKYHSRGWNYYEPDDEPDDESDEEVSEEELDFRMYKIEVDLKSFQLYKDRWVGDKYSWVIPFDTGRIAGDGTNYLALANRMHVIDEAPACKSAFNPIAFSGWRATWDDFFKLIPTPIICQASLHDTRV